ncbi:MAG: hypothetical protein ACT4OE_00495 [Sphingosinicella sp.]
MNDMVKAPAHLWIVGILATLWNGFGCYDYVMSQMGDADYLAAMGVTQEHIDYMATFPAWVDGAWAFGVWGGLLGSLLLLVRSRFAVIAFALSLLGLASSTFYTFAMTTPPADMWTAPMLAMHAVIWAVVIFLLVYAMRMKNSGVLR